MAVVIKEVISRRELKEFVKLPFRLYRGNPYWVPPLIRDELETLDPKRNPAFDTAEAKLFLAYQGDRPVGRVAAILSHIANQKYQTQNLRFGWLEFREDYETAAALLGAVEDWGRRLGLKTLTGPHGFCDLDRQGMLIEGFDRLATIATNYNPPFYPRYLERYGFVKEVDYVEIKSLDPDYRPPVALKLAQRVRSRSRVRLLAIKRNRDMKPWLDQFFRLLNQSYDHVYGAVPLSEKQIEYYLRKYLPVMDPRLVQGLVDESDRLVGFFIGMPNLSRAFQKARGRLLPWGWLHIWRACRRFERVDFYLAAVREEYRGTGVILLMLLKMLEQLSKLGVYSSESNPIMESNNLVAPFYLRFNSEIHKRRRIYRKRITPRTES